MSTTSEVKLIKVPAKYGCYGCYYDTHGGCDVDEYIEVKGLPIPDASLWDCNDPSHSYIFIPEGTKPVWESDEEETHESGV